MAAELVTIETGIKYQKHVNGTWNSVRKVPTGKMAYLFRFSTFSGNFPMGRTDERFSIFYWTEIFWQFWLNGKCPRISALFRKLTDKRFRTLSIREKHPEISVGAKVEFPIGKKLFHLVVNPGTWGARLWTWTWYKLREMCKLNT